LLAYLGYQVLWASGSTGNPGLNSESGLVVQSMGTNGAAPTDMQFVSTAVQAVRSANAEASAIIANPKVVGTVSRLNASTYAKYWDIGFGVPALDRLTEPCGGHDGAATGVEASRARPRGLVPL
jgi:hypothetical protein